MTLWQIDVQLDLPLSLVTIFSASQSQSYTVVKSYYGQIANVFLVKYPYWGMGKEKRTQIKCDSSVVLKLTFTIIFSKQSTHRIHVASLLVQIFVWTIYVHSG